MKRIGVAALFVTLVAACTPVIRQDLMEKGTRVVHFEQLRKNPQEYMGRLFILGGIIAEAETLKEGTRIEAVYVPADRYGNLLGIEHESNRFMAFYPAERGLLDPLIYRKGREVTVAGEFMGIEKGKIGGMDYTYPVFLIRDIHLWEEKRGVYILAPHFWRPFWWDDHWWYDPYYPLPYIWP